jgi:hypothetical protein
VVHEAELMSKKHLRAASGWPVKQMAECCWVEEASTAGTGWLGRSGTTFCSGAKGFRRRSLWLRPRQVRARDQGKELGLAEASTRQVASQAADDFAPQGACEPSLCEHGTKSICLPVCSGWWAHTQKLGH